MINFVRATFRATIHVARNNTGLSDMLALGFTRLNTRFYRLSLLPKAVKDSKLTFLVSGKRQKTISHP